MKVVDKRKKSVMFGLLEEGTVFNYENFEDRYFMKMKSTYCNDCGDYNNAVDITDGELLYFHNDLEVYPLNGKFIIE